jgi:dCTP deaminase
VLERGAVYVAPLAEELALPAGVRARFNPRSSTGRCDIFTRVLCSGHARFDEAPEGFAGRLWLEIAPLSFAVLLRAGDRLCQARFARGRARLDRAELCAAYEREPLCFVREGGRERPLALGELSIDDEGGLLLSASLAGRDPAGWRAALRTGVLRFAARAAHDPADFFEPVRAPHGRLILEPGRFYVVASRERLRIPPELAAEMQPVDVGIGELRNNYAGFFDSGFGWRADGAGRPAARGTPAVLEVRARDVPFLLEDGQVFFRLSFFRTSARPDALYGEGRDSYADQDLTLARCFHAPSTPGA